MKELADRPRLSADDSTAGRAGPPLGCGDPYHAMFINLRRGRWGPTPGVGKSESSTDFYRPQGHVEIGCPGLMLSLYTFLQAEPGPLHPVFERVQHRLDQRRSGTPPGTETGSADTEPRQQLLFRLNGNDVRV